MAYRLKTVRYQNSDRKILLQNENGPCPLLAAANALLLKGVISLPTECIRTGVASIEDVTNVLAEQALSTSSGKDHYLHELLSIFPKLQFGMDVNPKFTAGPTGVEYTSNLTAFDMLHVDLVHGWLLDPQDSHTTDLLKNKTYNELIEVVVRGNEAASHLETLNATIIEKETELTQLDETSGDEEKQEKEQMDEEKDSDDAQPSKDKEEKEPEPPAEDDNKKEEDEWVNVAEATSNSEAVDETEIMQVKATPLLKGESTEEELIEVEKVEATTEGETAVKSTREEGATANTSAVAATKDLPEKKIEQAIDTTSTVEKKVSEPTNEKEGEPEGEAPTSNEETLSVPERKAKLESELVELREKRHELSTLATDASLINTFLDSTSHQLTHYGLHELYSYVKDGALCVFFRNNHFATMTKHAGVLYLLVTDLGYANVPDVVWEKLDGIDGDTEYVNAAFSMPAPQAELSPAAGPSLSPEDLLAQRGQTEADFQLALELSKHSSNPTRNMDEEEGKLVAAATEASLRSYNGIESETKEEETAAASVGVPTNGIIDGCSTQEDSDKLMAMHLQAQMDNDQASMHLARKLQNEERQRAKQNATNGRRTKDSTSSSCVIS